ncbi:TPA: hypothetical protein JLC69_000433 [Escherichia coli]|nr:hypothetical protein [Escherichia coli]
MHEKNIALLCDEADRLLQLNINLLRQMVEEPDVLSDSKNENRLLFDKQKALKRIEELEGEQIKTARREMVLAVVGTMKAGKSTTINAIVGQEILPNRNRPMTSVPTLIRHVPGKTEPVLHLEHIQPVRNLLITLQEKLATPAGQQVAQTLQQTGDTRELLDILTDDGWLKNEYHGEEEIFTGLASLNDLVRLAAAMGTEFPFDEYAEVQKLPVIDVEFSHLVGMDACQGTLTLLDTPGPNEAGQPQMEVMMRDQLQKASAVLAVMDYTQMNSKADEDVRKELNAIADVSAGRLFVLVNKFDEKDRNGDGADAVRQKVPAMLNSDVLPASRVYPGSSRQAYLNNQNQLIAGETLFTGTINRTEVHPREVIKRALYHNAAAVVLAHNHPSGEVTPSKADRLITERLVQALGLVDIRVPDHLIVGGNQVFSFAEHGLL